MSPFRDPEWQLHIPQKEYTTNVLTHLYCITRGARCGIAGSLGRRPVAFRSRSKGTAQAVSQRSKPYKTYIVTESEA
jgi:hypothetical protein